MAVKFGLEHRGRRRAARCSRKNYFYPDLPKGYQISQYELPVVKQGRLAVMPDDGAVKTIGITRAHPRRMRASPRTRAPWAASGIDLNRAGNAPARDRPEPDMRSAKEAALRRTFIPWCAGLEICDGNMQEKSFRCDANVSVRPRGREKFGTCAEIKNLNSLRFVEKAIQHEVARQIDVLESGRHRGAGDAAVRLGQGRDSSEAQGEANAIACTFRIRIFCWSRSTKHSSLPALAGAARREGGASHANSACRLTMPGC